MKIRDYTNKLTRRFWRSKVYWSPRRLFVPLSKIEIDRPIFILGTQGGGNTLICRVLARHPNVVKMVGNNRFWTGSNEMHNTNFWHQLGRLKGIDEKLLPEKLTLMRKEDHPVFGLYKGWVYATDSLYNEYRLTENDYDPESAGLLIERIKISLRAYAQDISSVRFLDKSQTYSLKIPFLRECLDDPLFILVVRNPYAMCWRAATRVYEKGHENRIKYGGRWNVKMPLDKRLEIAAQHWVNTFNTALSDLQNSNDGYILSFEDFLTDAESKLEEILEFVGLEYSPDLLPKPEHRKSLWNDPGYKWYPLRPDVNKRYLGEITSEAVEVIHSYAGVLADRFGYERPC